LKGKLKLKNFVKLIEDVHKERFNAVINNLIAKKIPAAFLSVGNFEMAVENVKNLRAQNLNVTNLITLSNAPPPGYGRRLGF